MEPDKEKKESEKEKKEAEPSTARKRVSMEDFTLKHRLGKGAYGDVFLVIKNSDHKAYALKQIQKRKLEREQKQYQALVQRELLTNFKHPGIIQLRYSFQDKQSLYFVQQYCQGGQFINFIKANFTKLTEKARIFYIAEIVNLLQYLHSNGVTHRDLKPENLMLSKRGHLKLIDFGTAQISNCSILKPQFKEHIIKLKQKADQKIQEAKEEQQTPSENSEMDSPLKKRRSTFVGTCYYISPELLEQNYCPASADLWALGCIIYQIYYMDTPFKDSYEFAVFEKIKKAEYSFPKLDIISDDAIDLIKKLLVKNPEERLGSGTTQQLSYQKLKSHPYFQGLDIDNIFNSPVPYIPDLQYTQRTEQEKKEYEQALLTFRAQCDSIIKTLKEQGKQIIKSDIMEQKTFIIYGHVLLILFSDNEIMMITADEVERRRPIVLRKGQGEKVKLLSQNDLLIQDQSRDIELKTPNAEEWIVALNKIA